ncbi:hypothetical protein KC368_g49 [Hortaea werneckii]|nr:hypothetical protein KC368_g49 [Hortaea werneckii]
MPFGIPDKHTSLNSPCYQGRRWCEPALHSGRTQTVCRMTEQYVVQEQANDLLPICEQLKVKVVISCICTQFCRKSPPEMCILSASQLLARGVVGQWCRQESLREKSRLPAFKDLTRQLVKSKA